MTVFIIMGLIITPITLTFYLDDHEKWYINSTINTVFMCDVVVRFFTGNYDYQTQSIVLDPKIVARYVRVGIKLIAIKRDRRLLKGCYYCKLKNSSGKLLKNRTCVTKLSTISCHERFIRRKAFSAIFSFFFRPNDLRSTTLDHRNQYFFVLTRKYKSIRRCGKNEPSSTVVQNRCLIGQRKI